MKLAMFTTKEALVAWYEREIEAITKNGLRQAREDYENALKGIGKEKWLTMNNCSVNNEEIWQQHLDWLRGQVKYMERKIRKYQRQIVKNS